MCRVCGAADLDLPVPVCRSSGETIYTMTIGGEACPRGRHPDAAGVVRWPVRPVKWHGIPGPVRYWLAGLGYRPAAAWQGCGCLVAAKRLTAWLGLATPAGWLAMRIGRAIQAAAK
jgi:hypothetical protein